MKFLLLFFILILILILLQKKNNNFQLKTDYEIKQDSCIEQTKTMAIKNTWGLVKMSEFYNNCLES